MENLARCYLKTNQQQEEAATLIGRALALERRPEWVRWLKQQSIHLNARAGRDKLASE